MTLGLALSGYWLLFTAAAALLMLPAWRNAMFTWARRRADGCGRLAHGSRSAWAASWQGVRSTAVNAVGTVSRCSMRQWSRAGALLAALAMPPLLGLWLGNERWLGSFDDASTRRIDPLILELLQGEQLVPPSSLPPDLFTSHDLMAERPLLASASREWSALDADFRQRLLLVFKLMREQHGYELALLEGYRSPERQALLRARGPQVTQAAAFQSLHQHGLAADCAFHRDGRLVIGEKDPWALRGYQLMGQVAESVGLQWGGRWTSIVDLGHVELRRVPAAAR